MQVRPPRPTIPSRPQQDTRPPGIQLNVFAYSTGAHEPHTCQVPWFT